MEDESAPLPDELITEILVRLPVKSLVRFKIVSKSWHALIRSPYFVNQHLKHDHKGTILFLTHMSLHPRTIEERGIVMYLHDPDSSDFCRLSAKVSVPLIEWNGLYTDIVGPCNGLFFVSYRSTSMLCNPALRESKMLPPRPIYRCGHEKVLTHQQDGLGFDPLTGSYKVIGIYDMYSSPPEVELYDSRSNRWRIIDSTHGLLPYVYYASSGLFFEGACHWVGHDDDSSQPPVVLSFDVSTEVFRYFEFPKLDYGYYEEDHRLSTLRDRLTLVIRTRFSRLAIPTCIDIWVMEEYGAKESWAQTFKIEVNSHVHAVSFFWKDEWILVKGKYGVPKSIDLHSGGLGRAFALRGLPYWWRAAVFKESLISLDDVIRNPI